MNITLIASAGTGKDFLAEYLIKKYGYTRYAFADNVKLLAEVWFPDLYGNGEEKPRKLLQDLGTKFREIDKDVWIDAMFSDIDNNANSRKRRIEAQEVIVVTDCRMPNEYEALKNRGFTFIRITTDPAIREARLLNRGDKFSENDLKHHTESFYDSFECDYEIENNRSVEEAYHVIDEVIKTIQKRCEKLE